MRLFIAFAIFFVSVVVAFIDLPSKSESGCRASKTGPALASLLCLQSPEAPSDVNEDFRSDTQQPAVIVSHHKPESNSIYTQQPSFEPASARWLATSIGPAGLEVLKEKIGATWTIPSRMKMARSEGALGQTPWYGMALGLMCTTLAAVMLG